MAPPSPCTRFAFSYPSLEEDGSLVKLLALYFRQLVPVNPLLLTPFHEYFEAILSFLGFSTAYIAVRSLEAWFSASPAGG